MYISDKQHKILADIKKLNEWKGENSSFIQGEIPGLTAHTINALFDKWFLYHENSPLGVKYYKWTGKELEKDE